ncbi:MAG: ABC transporter substrate-binding protein/permease [Lactobacillales bacterium]|jgi:polar amino acid transport system substrate-binding protein|nr:ABC transporter substrate-binding protein/permease [Lactobacillales bacterium]
MKKITKILGLFIILISFVASGAAVLADDNATLAHIKETGKLTIGMSPDYPPFEFHANIDGKDKIVGADVTLAEQIAKDLGVKLEIKAMDFDAILTALSSGQVDIGLSGFTKTPERAKQFDFSDPYYTSPQALIVRKEDLKKYSTLESLKDEKVGAQKGSLQEQILKDNIPSASKVLMPDLAQLVSALKTGAINALVIEKPIGESYLEHNPTLSMTDITYPNLDPEGSSNVVMINKNNQELVDDVNATIARVGDSMSAYVKDANDLANSQADETDTHKGGGLNFSFIGKYLPYYFEGALVTILVSIGVVILGSVLGFFLALMKRAKNVVLKTFASVYIAIFRGTPMLLQILIAFVLIQVHAPRIGSGIFQIDLSLLIPGFVAIALNSAAYVAETIRGGINAVDAGQIEAAKSLGLRPAKAMMYVVLPQALRNVLPAIGNEVVTIIKDSSLLSTIGLAELLFVTKDVQTSTYIPLEPLLVAGLFYFIMTFIASQGVKLLESSMEKGYK